MTDEVERHHESCPLHWLPKGRLGAKCWCKSQAALATTARDDVGDVQRVVNMLRKTADELGMSLPNGVGNQISLAADTIERLTTVGDADVETGAEEVFEAMQWAAEHAEGGNPPDWVPHGNSTAQSKARMAAKRILALRSATGSSDDVRINGLTVAEQIELQQEGVPDCERDEGWNAGLQRAAAIVREYGAITPSAERER